LELSSIEKLELLAKSRQDQTKRLVSTHRSETKAFDKKSKEKEEKLRNAKKETSKYRNYDIIPKMSMATTIKGAMVQNMENMKKVFEMNKDMIIDDEFGLIKRSDIEPLFMWFTRLT
jgi:carboxylesterase type B